MLCRECDRSGILGGDKGRGAADLPLTDFEKLRKSTRGTADDWKGFDPASARSSASNGSAGVVARARPEVDLDSVFCRLACGGESGSCSRTARVDSRLRPILRSDGGGGGSRMACSASEPDGPPTGRGLKAAESISITLREKIGRDHSRCFFICKTEGKTQSA